MIATLAPQMDLGNDHLLCGNQSAVDNLSALVNRKLEADHRLRQSPLLTSGWIADSPWQMWLRLGSAIVC
jgi:hypothetical protein